MTATVGTLNGKPILRGAVSIPKCGIWSASVEVSAPTNEPMQGEVTIDLGRQGFKGTVIDGAPYEGRAWYRVVGGKAGWRKRIPATSWRGAGGVKVSTVVKSAADACGEVLAPITDRKIGPYFARLAPPEGNAEAARVLDLVSPHAWYVDVDGLTYLGTRAASTWAGHYTLLEKRADAQRLMIAADDITGLVPGAKVENIEATHIRHELGDDGLRTHIFGAKGISARARVRQAFERLVERITHKLIYQRTFEYRVVSQSGGYLDLQPVRDSDGVPAIKNVAMYVGIPGGRGKPAVGSTVRVAFTNGDPTLPYIATYDGEANAGWKPTHIGLEASTQADLWAPEVRIGGPSAVTLAKSAEVQTALNALKALAYDANDSVKYSPNPGWTTVAEIRTAMSTLWTALGGSTPTNLTYAAINTGKGKSE